MGLELRKWAEEYYKKWKVTPIPVRYAGDMVPLLAWGSYYEDPNPQLPETDRWNEATGIAILPKGSHVTLDFDIFTDEEERKLVADWLHKHGYIVVVTRRGLHVHFNSTQQIGEIRIYKVIEDGKQVRIGEGGGQKFKHVWTVPPSLRQNFRYRFHRYSSVPDLPTVSFEDFVDDIELIMPKIRFQHVKHESLAGVESATLEMIELIPNVEKLTVRELLILLVYIYKRLNCVGLMKLTIDWLTKGTVGLRKVQWGTRTTRFYYLHTITATLALLGVDQARVADILETYEDLDGKPADAHRSALWTVYRWNTDLFKRLYVMRRTQCPFCLLTGSSGCGKNPVMRVYYYLQSRGREEVAKVVQKLLARR